MNAFRQAHALGAHLVVGINSDDSVAEAKGLRPVMTSAERQTTVAACRFVDEIITDVPYVMTEEYMRDLFENHGIDYIVHGDDPCVVDGRDVYELPKSLGRFLTIPRTENISTTDIVGRLLSMTGVGHKAHIPDVIGARPPIPGFKRSKFLVTSELMRDFSAALPAQGRRAPGRVVYTDGAFDMFHAGHVELLRKAKELGAYLLVGIHSDEDVGEHRGRNHPVMSLHERALGVLGCRYVDDVLLNAPWSITQEMISTLGIDAVCRGTARDVPDAVARDDPHAVPQSMGIWVELPSELPLTLEIIGERLESRREEVQKRHTVKEQLENDWFRQKHGICGP